MVKAYPEQLGEWLGKRAVSRRDRNFAVFLAMRDEIQEALDAGYFVKTIWENLHETKRTTLGYQMFLMYVNRYIRKSAPKLVQTRLAVSVKPAAAKPEVSKPAKSVEQTPVLHAHGKDSIPGFSFNSIPNKEDLI